MTDLEQLEIQIETAQSMRSMRDSCVRLENNADFKKVIGDGYFKEEAARLVMAKSADLNEVQQKNIDGMILGVGGLANFLNIVMRRGAESDMAVGELEQTQADILAEEVS